LGILLLVDTSLALCTLSFALPSSCSHDMSPAMHELVCRLPGSSTSSQPRCDVIVTLTIFSLIHFAL
jgi:hypothetical protein